MCSQNIPTCMEYVDSATKKFLGGISTYTLWAPSPVSSSQRNQLTLLVAFWLGSDSKRKTSVVAASPPRRSPPSEGNHCARSAVVVGFLVGGSRKEGKAPGPPTRRHVGGVRDSDAPPSRCRDPVRDKPPTWDPRWIHHRFVLSL